MNILIVSATAFEIAPFMEANNTADILITGVGTPSCMYALTKKLQQKNYDFVIQAGIAGTFKNTYALGESFIIKNDTYADLGILEKGNLYTLFDAGFVELNATPYQNGWLQNEGLINVGLPIANSITVNTVSESKETTDIYRKKFDADLESMEGAAFHYVCISESIPFLQLRSVSNFVGERIKTNWKMREAIDSLNFNLSRIVELLNIEH
jgi:futalosine hydrolase